MMTPAKLIRKVFYEKKGYTLVEVIIASTIFTMVGVMGMVIFVNVLRIQRKIDLENAIYEDGRYLMERISREVRQNAIDYEEYFNITEGGELGERFGCYAKEFYNPGTDGDLGALCNNGKSLALDPGCTIDKSTLDINTGVNPYTRALGKEAGAMNAFCDSGDVATCTDSTLFGRDKLFLISGSGQRKTMIARKKIYIAPVGGEDEYAVSMLRLTGRDMNLDGIFEKWVDVSGGAIDYSDYCNEGYDCEFSSLDQTPEGNLEEGNNLFEGFVPISPMRTHVKDLKFFVSPMEDPRKAFAETDPTLGIQQQPHVTVVMTLTPAADQLTSYAGEAPEITLQTTVTSRVNNEVESYYPEVSCSP